ncbi:XTP/dITP diphosphohydrolase [Keratinibaculum paraultunense]|uniref:dITP/XTP pyrophosphatase n=1 Tax=Keratinibaculum paraultunense TaxID=1278232 RepID=A0A4V2UUI4_9FIRM|nr:RdgB/HAM1 family non-canonical purine NTP pyrophosphatase [Keratinibaculum paraultunense]QQY80205.1 RdgB/HAM1 family non-canonical purine NTP pyrophosphatase [Keratinibaculum paraultunense]TCS90716.1 XTP/dITP diphosphohydrolase [Keratinibaculum paraultunense]
MARRKLILATGNLDKVVEMKEILKDLPVDIFSKKDLELEEFEVVEDGKTLEENAMKKAMALKEKVEGIIIADDTGLFVKALNGAPGVYSARYGGIEHDYIKNNNKLLEELKNVPIDKREAYFKTVIVVILEDGSSFVVEGVCEGAIGFELKGDNGFGYDPLFIPKGYDKSFGELGLDIKNKISHRAKALEKLKEQLYKILKDDAHEDICSK